MLVLLIHVHAVGNIFSVRSAVVLVGGSPGTAGLRDGGLVGDFAKGLGLVRSEQHRRVGEGVSGYRMTSERGVILGRRGVVMLQVNRVCIRAKGGEKGARSVSMGVVKAEAINARVSRVADWAEKK